MASWKLWRARVRAETQAALDWLRQPWAEPQPPTAHLLAISDIHLGHDIKRGRRAVTGDVPSLDLHLGGFLDHYRTHREDGLPWRLVIVGDMVDFIAITLTPEKDEGVPFEVTAEEELYGLGTEPEKARWKLERVFERHTYFFTRLARFVAEGNELVIVRGNHDQEWTWPEVQACFREKLTALAGQPVTALLPVRFCDWFYLEPGRFYAEHGHFYDEFSNGADLMPAPTSRAIREPVSTLAQRYFANKHTTLDMNEVERWSMLDFLRWGMQGGRLIATFGDYLAMCMRVLAFSVRASWATTRRSVTALADSGRQALEEDQLTRVRTALRTVRMDYEELAQALLALTRTPADQSVLATAQMLYIDRLLLGVFAGAAAASCVAISAPPASRLSIAGGVLLGAVFVNRWLRRSRLVDSHPKLIAAASRVSALFRVPLVVMGHSHRVVAQSVAHGSHYYNLGTWMAPSREVSGSVGFPHVIVSRGGHVLRRWPLSTTPDMSEVA